MSVARVFKTPTPFNAVELADLDYAQVFDIVYLAHLDHDPTKLVRSAHASWAFSSISFGPTIDPPTAVGVSASTPNTDIDNSGNDYFPQPATYGVTAISDDTGQESRLSLTADATNDLDLKRNKNVVSWAAVEGASKYRVYKAENQQAFGFIGESKTTTFTDDNLGPDLTDGPPEAYNPFGTTGDKPSSVAFFEQGLFWGRTRNNPNAIYRSRSADFENMDVSTPLREDDAISIRIAAQKVNSVNALVPLEKLLALTGDGVFLVRGSNQDYIAANPPPIARRQSGAGVNRLKPIVVGDAVFYTPAVGNGVHSLGFTFEIDGYQSSDVSIFSPGFFRGFSIKSWGYAEEPMSVIVAARNDGKAPCFTWQREQQVWGWTMWETDGAIEQVATVPEDGESRIYWVVRRTIKGVERRFLERLGSAKWDDVRASCYVDSAVTFEPTEPTSRFYIPHLAGKTVSAMIDGFALSNLSVDDDGWVDLGQPVNDIVTIGLPFSAVIETLPMALATQQGSLRGKKQMLGNVIVQLSRTRLGGVETGRSLDQMFPMKARTNEPLGSPTRLFTGLAEAQTAKRVTNEATLFIRSSDPLPMTVTSVFLEPVVSED